MNFQGLAKPTRGAPSGRLYKTLNFIVTPSPPTGIERSGDLCIVLSVRRRRAWEKLPRTKGYDLTPPVVSLLALVCPLRRPVDGSAFACAMSCRISTTVRQRRRDGARGVLSSSFRSTRSSTSLKVGGAFIFLP